MSFRIAYLAEIFPHQSETWVHHEIRALEARGCVVRVFATHPRPSTITDELEKFVEITTYLGDLRMPFWRTVMTSLQPKLWVPVLRAMVLDTQGIRQKAQVLRDLVYAGRLSQGVQEFQPDVLFAHFAGTRTNLAMFLSLLSDIPYSFKMHSSDVFNRVAIFRLKMDRAAVVTTISDYNIRFIKDAYPDIDVSKLKRHPCGIPLEVFARRKGAPGRAPPRLVSVGRLVRPKGFDVLIRASRLLLDRGVAHEIVIVGDGPERRTLERLILDLQVSGTVRLLGYAPPEQVQEEVLSANVFVLPCVFDPIAKTHDGLPVALIEAMALGVPIVSTNISAIPELVENGVSGILVTPGEPEPLAVGIMDCLALSSEVRDAMVISARHKVESDYDADILAAELLDILASAVGLSDGQADGADALRVRNG